MPFRIRRILFMLAVAELGACRGGARAPTPAVALGPQRVKKPLDDDWVARSTTVVLADGRTLVIGGGTARAALWDGETLVEIASMPESRELATASLLPDGRVLIAGGISGYDENEGAFIAETTFLWSLDGGFVLGPPMLEPRVWHTATTLLDGDVLVIGGDPTASGLDAITPAERFLADENRWVPAGELRVGRKMHTADLLPDGRVIVIGGEDVDLGTTDVIEIWDELAGGFVDGGALGQSRHGHQVQVMSATEVVVTGGTHVIPPDEGPPIRTDLSDIEVIRVPPRAPPNP
jgi:hypothetical protein